VRRQLAAGARAFLRDAALAYASAFRSLGGTLLFLVSAAAATAAIVVPMWLLASRSPRLFTVLVLSLFGLGCAAAVALSIRRGAREQGGARAWLRHRFVPLLGRIGFALLTLLVLYGLLLGLAARRYVAAAAVALFYTLLLGWRAHRRRAPDRSSPPPSSADADGDGYPRDGSSREGNPA